MQVYYQPLILNKTEVHRGHFLSKNYCFEIKENSIDRSLNRIEFDRP